MWTYGFFNSVNNDRIYNADAMSSIFEGLITDGVYESVGNKLAVGVNSGMVIQIDTGRGWFGKKWVNNDTPYLITLEPSDVLLNRYAAVCIRVDISDDTRSAEPYIKYSDFETNPVKPTMERTENVKEYCLAYVYIGAGVTSISASNIEDTRNDTSLCGWVTGLIDQIDANTLYTQFTAMFEEWFEGLQDRINENTETMLVNALPTSLSLTLPVSGWTLNGGVYKQEVTVLNMNETKSVIIQGNDSTIDAFNSAEITCTSQGLNALTFSATSLPTVAIIIDVLHMGE